MQRTTSLKKVLAFFTAFTAVTFFLKPAAAARNSREAQTEAFLQRFHENTAEVMDERPPRVRADGSLERESDLPFGFDTFLRDEAVEAKSATRDWVMERADAKIFAPFGDNDRPENLVYSPRIDRNIISLHQRGVENGASSISPWSDSYWPIYRGLIGYRYADGSFPHDTKDWTSTFAYFEETPPAALPYGARSPAEKYDTLVGDGGFSLTQWNWNKGKKQMEWWGRVASWMGICHGWAAAAHMLVPVAKRPVTVPTAYGSTITFRPSDVKALTSLLWAESNYTTLPTRFLGGRCETGRPKKDPAGRVVDPDCFDSNPGTWHVAITNQMGLGKHSFVIDSTFDFEVWNFPLQKYESGYFNPQTLRATRNLDSAIVAIEDFTIDKFPGYRSPKTKYVVGVVMDVTHVNVWGPTTRDTHPEPDTKTVRFAYDLELDANMNIIGGEWYTNRHPDFLWTFNPGAKAYSVGDHDIGIGAEWDGKSPLPENWRKAAAKASNQGEPMANIIDVLVRLGGGLEEPEEPEEPGGPEETEETE